LHRTTAIICILSLGIYFVVQTIIKKKFRLLIMLSAGAAIILAGGFFGSYGIVFSSQEMILNTEPPRREFLRVNDV
jgi:hypothetical protein